MAHVWRAVATLPDGGVQTFVGSNQFDGPDGLVVNRWVDDTCDAVASWEVR